METTNLFDLPEDLPGEERFESLLERPGLRLERIVTPGASVPGEWYDQAWEEWVVLLQGEAVLEFEDGRVLPLGAGDAVLLPAHVRHRVARAGGAPPCIWLALHVARGGEPAPGEPARGAA